MDRKQLLRLSKGVLFRMFTTFNSILFYSMVFDYKNSIKKWTVGFSSQRTLVNATRLYILYNKQMRLLKTFLLRLFTGPHIFNALITYLLWNNAEMLKFCYRTRTLIFRFYIVVSLQNKINLKSVNEPYWNAREKWNNYQIFFIWWLSMFGGELTRFVTLSGKLQRPTFLNIIPALA